MTLRYAHLAPGFTDGVAALLDQYDYALTYDEATRFYIVTRASEVGQNFEGPYPTTKLIATPNLNSDDVTLSCYAGEDAEEAYSDLTNDRPVWTRTLTATYDASVRRRARGGAFYFKLRNNTNNESWGMEGGRVVTHSGSRTMERVE